MSNAIEALREQLVKLISADSTLLIESIDEPGVIAVETATGDEFFLEIQPA